MRKFLVFLFTVLLFVPVSFAQNGSGDQDGVPFLTNTSEPVATEEVIVVVTDEPEISVPVEVGEDTIVVEVNLPEQEPAVPVVITETKTDNTLVYVLVVVVIIVLLVALKVLNRVLDQNHELSKKLQDATPPWMDSMVRESIENGLLKKGDKLVATIPGEADNEFWAGVREEFKTTMRLVLGDDVITENQAEAVAQKVVRNMITSAVPKG